MKKPRVAFCPADNNNLKHFEMMKNSLRKFHSEEELPLLLIGEQEIASYNDPDFFYRATPLVADKLIKEYETVIKLDADQIITGKLNHLWEGDFDVAVVNNSNPREMATYPVSVWNINPLAYVNCGLVVMKSEKFVSHWLKLCMSAHFPSYQFREQDLLNILVFYGDYSVRLLDSGDTWHGLISKGYWPQVELRGKNHLVLPKNEEWPTDEDKKIAVIHWAGGNSPEKMNYKLFFNSEVQKWLSQLVNL